jgi:cysteinyl-tRNA synthetase
MSLCLYNTYAKREEEFHPLKAGVVTMYTCGPTVYGRPHIGNYSSFLMADLLRRWLEIGHGYDVRHVKNITDVGHLVADRDEGEDKVEKEAKAKKLDPLAIAGHYTAQYLEDEKLLNMREPLARPCATAYIREMLALVQTLLKEGHAYETDDGMYFSVETFPQYGRLSGNTLDKLAAGARVSVHEAKKHPADFALWKKCIGANAHHLLRWSFETGKQTETVGEDPLSGFPGWHIECSAMASSLLGPQIDIHTGGEDNIFPHHECEIAQSECALQHSPFVRTWVHRRRIDLAGEKMSKSLGNVLSLPAVAEKGYHPLDLRYYLLSVHYRTNLKFSWKGMDDVRIARRKIMDWMTAIDQIKTVEKASSHGVSERMNRFKESMDKDLNTPAALAEIFSAMNFFYAHPHMTVADLSTYQQFVHFIRETFGCFEQESPSETPSDVQALLDARATARAQKDFKESDRLRDEIKKLGYEVRDAGREQSVRCVI